MTTATEKQELRKRLLDACIAREQFLIDDFKARIKALTESEGLGNEEAYETDDTASNSARVAEIDALNHLLEFTKGEMQRLENMKLTQDVERNRVAPGAIVVTDRRTFFISTGIENIAADGHSYTGLSTASPLYQAMDGKRAGDDFVYDGLHYTITDIF